MTVSPDQLKAAELAIANVVALVLPLSQETLNATADEHERVRDATPATDPARPFMDAGAAASRAVATLRGELGRVEPPAITGWPPAG